MPHSEFHPSFLELADKVSHRYPELPNFRIGNELHRIAGLVNDIAGLSGRKVLDLGAGAVESTESLKGWSQIFARFLDPYRLIQYQPWFCRIAHLAGAEPCAVDIGDNSLESFESVRLDLSNPDALAHFDSESFDYVNNYFFTAHLEEPDAWEKTSPGLRRVASQNSTDPGGWVFKLNDAITSHVERILKPHGIYIHNSFRFQKKDGILGPFRG